MPGALPISDSEDRTSLAIGNCRKRFRPTQPSGLWLSVKQNVHIALCAARGCRVRMPAGVRSRICIAGLDLFLVGRLWTSRCSYSLEAASPTTYSVQHGVLKSHRPMATASEPRNLRLLSQELASLEDTASPRLSGVAEPRTGRGGVFWAMTDHGDILKGRPHEVGQEGKVAIRQGRVRTQPTPPSMATGA